MIYATNNPAPVTEAKRFETIDVVRGFALLGILVPNIVAFAWPSDAMAFPEAMGKGSWNEIGHAITAIFFLGKMMALFSMLFGAGVVIYGRKFDLEKAPDTGHQASGLTQKTDLRSPAPGASRPAPLSRGAALWYRRVAWLLAIGFFHAVFLWFGDILVSYAVVALMAVWWVRRINPSWHIGIGLLLHLASTIMMLAFTGFVVWAVERGYIPEDEMMGDTALEMSGYTGGYLDTFKPRLISLLSMWVVFTPMFIPGITGLMMIGMGLTRLGILTGERSTRFYAILTILGIVGGLGLTATLFYTLNQRWPEMGGFIWMFASQFVGIPISLGYMAALIWIVRLGLLKTLTNALANVGRMALSNYLLHTILCTTFFYGYGLGYFAKIDYPGLFAVVAAVWIINIIFSTLWLKAFRFGPAEWAWRCLTYWKLQPLRR